MAMMWRYLIISLVIQYGLAEHKLTRNVIFEKLKTISTTRSRWLLTFVIDLTTYEKALAKVKIDLEYPANILHNINTPSNQPEHDGMRRMFLKQETELQQSVREYKLLTKRYANYRELRSRHKRSLIPIVGDALGFLFGTLTESDLTTIKANINRISENQKEIFHVVKESLTIINLSRTDIQENRHAINDVIDDMAEIYNWVNGTTEWIENELNKIQNHLSIYLSIDYVMNEIRDNLQRIA
jgi:methyl-accepting chemotaxis protein